MSKVPADLKYTTDHCWLRTEANGVIAVGITEVMIRTTGDIENLKLPQVGKTFAADDSWATSKGSREPLLSGCPLPARSSQ